MHASIQAAITAAYGAGWLSTVRAIGELNDILLRRRLTTPDPVYRPGIRALSDNEAKQRMPVLNVVLPLLDLGTITAAGVQAAVTELMAAR